MPITVQTLVGDCIHFTDLTSANTLYELKSALATLDATAYPLVALRLTQASQASWLPDHVLLNEQEIYHLFVEPPRYTASLDLDEDGGYTRIPMFRVYNQNIDNWRIHDEFGFLRWKLEATHGDLPSVEVDIVYSLANQVYHSFDTELFAMVDDTGCVIPKGVNPPSFPVMEDCVRSVAESLSLTEEMIEAICAKWALQKEYMIAAMRDEDIL